MRSQALSGIHTNPTGPVRSQECTYNFTGLLVCSQGCNRTQTPNQDTPHNLSPPPGFHVFILHILQETTRPSVCASQVRGSTLRCLCSLVAYLCRVVSPRYQSGRVRLVAPLRSAGLAWFSLAQDLYGSGRHESGIRTTASYHLPPCDLAVRGASIVRCGLSCLVDLNLDLYHLCSSLPDTFWAWGFS